MSDDIKSPHINGDTNVVPITAAKQIMQDPAGASETAQETSVTAPGIKDAGTKKLLDQLPGLVGAIDHAIKDTSGKHMGFVLLIFSPEASLHATNLTPANQGFAAAKQVLDNMDLAEPGAPEGAGGAANDGG